MGHRCPGPPGLPLAQRQQRQYPWDEALYGLAVLALVRETGLQLLRLVLSYAFGKALATLLLLGDRRRVAHRSLGPVLSLY